MRCSFQLTSNFEMTTTRLKYMSDIFNPSSKVARGSLTCSLTVGDPEVLAPIIVRSESATPVVTCSTHLQHLALAPNLRHKSAPVAGSADTDLHSRYVDTLSGIGVSSVEVHGAELVDCGDDADVFLHAAVAIVPHGPEVWAGGDGCGEGEESDKAEEEDAEAAAEHLCCCLFGSLVLVSKDWSLVR